MDDLIQGTLHLLFCLADVEETEEYFIRYYHDLCKPDFGWQKLNIDGYCKRNPRSVGGGGVIRDHQGSFIVAFVEYYGQCTNNFEEANAMLHGLKLYFSGGFLNIIQISSKGNFTFVHAYGEGNSVADQLVNLGESLKVKVTFDTTSSLSDIVRSSPRLDHVGFPNFRFKPRKNHFTINDVSRYS
ncbi:uncharacterized protein LOC142175927 [Nicotiana tabacum]|uniref:Uncharacterized protein LOC142175927 n=1 Tax=Nicotiana tabacum TaxID=4097 RepID=A0AC58TP86_TOBAC